MSSIRTLPKLAAMFLTEGHRIPHELLAASAPDPAPERPAPPSLDRWECPLDETHQFGLASASGNLPMRPPEY